MEQLSSGNPCVTLSFESKGAFVLLIVWKCEQGYGLRSGRQASLSPEEAGGSAGVTVAYLVALALRARRRRAKQGILSICDGNMRDSDFGGIRHRAQAVEVGRGRLRRPGF